MSSDTSPPRYQLQRPAETAQQVLDNPPWLKVIGTTLRLFLRRRILHVPDNRRISNRGRAAIAAFVVVIVAVAAVAVVLTVTHLNSGTARATDGARRAAHQLRPRLTPEQAQAKSNATTAAQWFAAEVSPNAVVACDPAMCGYLAAANFAGQQAQLEPGTTTLPANATLVVATGSVRGQYGAALAAAAPAVIAVFGSGPQAVQVRVVAPGGPAAYQQAARQALAARRRAGRALLANPHVHVRGLPRHDLVVGLVDPRLLVVLQRLAGNRQVWIVRFEDSGPLADPATPFRLVQINGLVVRRAGRLVSHVAAVQTFLGHQGAPYHPSYFTTAMPGGKVLLSIRFPAPSPY